jgi:hypothetical protein
MILQLVLARTGWFHRYEAYLLILGLLSIVASGSAWQAAGGSALPSGTRRLPAAVAVVGAGLLVLMGLGLRVNAWTNTPEACQDIAGQHLQMARFADQYYHDVPISLNDVGYVAYNVSGPILDLGGLGSHSVALARSNNEFTPQWVERAAEEHDVVIGIHYDLTVVPESWERVASWHTGATRVAGDETVHFYAIGPGTRDELLGNLREFESRLSPNVSVEYYGDGGV